MLVSRGKSRELKWMIKMILDRNGTHHVNGKGKGKGEGKGED